MATLGITDLKKGLGVNIKGKDCVILEAQHVKPGKGNTYVRTKYRDIRTGRVNEENFQQSAKFESVNMQTREMQYLYNDGDIYYFMDIETYEQVEVSLDLIGDNAKWFKENDTCLLQYANGVLYNVQPPMFIEAPSRPALSFRCPCTSTSVSASRSIPATASSWVASSQLCRTGTFQEHRKDSAWLRTSSTSLASASPRMS